ncbi:MAG TPA: glycoside hydrolase family 15 protein, partial [Bdellovibrionota bacterium]|nr:glycoside hydrolase family 15 protein [Bdellovibrionota bacterium]
VGNGPTDPSVDASLLLLSALRFPDPQLNAATAARIYQELKMGPDAFASSFLYRYVRQDDFGHPKSAFVLCSFWMVEALARLGQIPEARRILTNAMGAANSLGLYSEHFQPGELIQSGNFPQAYSHVGQINAAFAVSPPWNEVL